MKKNASHYPARLAAGSLGLVALTWLAAVAGGDGPSATQPAKLPFTIAKDTTYLLKPRAADGTIDYLAALNAEASGGVTPENNAAVPLIQAAGPGAIPKPQRAEFFKRLGIEPLPEDAVYFRGLHEIAQAGNSATTGPDYETVVTWEKRAMQSPWKKEDLPAVARWLEANEKPLALVVEATHRPRFYMPHVADGDKKPGTYYALLPSLGAYRAISRALVARAMLKWGSGDPDGGWADLLAVIRLGRTFERKITVIGQMCGIAVESIGCWSSQSILGDSQLTAPLIRKMLSGLRNLPSRSEEDWRRAFRWDRCCDLDAAQTIAASANPFATVEELFRYVDLMDAILHGLPPATQPATAAADSTRFKLDLDWDEVLREMNRWYDRWEEANAKPTFRERLNSYRAIAADLENQFQKFGRKDARSWQKVIELCQTADRIDRPTASHQFAVIWAHIAGSVAVQCLVANQHGLTVAWLTEVSLVLELYRADRSKYPDALSDLLPTYLPRIPADPFADQPLVYRRNANGYLLYSVGGNGKDDGGEHDDKFISVLDDIAVRVPPSTPGR